MQIWESPKSLCLTSGELYKPFHIEKCISMIVFCGYDLDVFMFFGILIACSFYDRSSPIYTQPRYLPPSKMLDADVTDSVIGEGCVIKVSLLEPSRYTYIFHV